MKKTKKVRLQLLSHVMALLVMCVMFMCISTTALAAEGKVTTASAKVRKEASTSSEAIGSAYNGETYDIVNEVTGADGKVWYQITFDGKTGYIRSDLMQKSGETSTPPATVQPTEVTDLQPVNCTVTGGQVNVRSIASTEGAKVAQVRQGEVMTINGQATDSAGKVWYRVNFTSNNGSVTGFVRYDFVSVSGELKPVEEVVTPPVVEQPTETPPIEETPVVIPALSKDYDTAEEEGVWYLIDNVENKRYNLENVMDAAIKNPTLYAEIEGRVKAQKGWITFLIILVILMMVGITLLALKLKDVMDEAYFTAVEKDTIRQRKSQTQVPRQGQGNGPQKNVMHTVKTGSGTNPQKPGAPAKTSVPKMNISRPGEGTSTPQTVKVSNPADTRSPKPVAQRPVSQKPATQKPAEARPAVARPSAPKPVVTDETKVMKPVVNAESKKYVDTSKQTWQSKNFMSDDEDDDMEYGFLDWDEGEE